MNRRSNLQRESTTAYTNTLERLSHTRRVKLRNMRQLKAKKIKKIKNKQTNKPCKSRSSSTKKLEFIFLPFDLEEKC
jgi:hypothetical protein